MTFYDPDGNIDYFETLNYERERKISMLEEQADYDQGELKNDFT